MALALAADAASAAALSGGGAAGALLVVASGLASGLGAPPRPRIARLMAAHLRRGTPNAMRAVRACIGAVHRADARVAAAIIPYLSSADAAVRADAFGAISELAARDGREIIMDEGALPLIIAEVSRSNHLAAIDALRNLASAEVVAFPGAVPAIVRALGVDGSARAAVRALQAFAREDGGAAAIVDCGGVSGLAACGLAPALRCLAALASHEGSREALARALPLAQMLATDAAAAAAAIVRKIAATPALRDGLVRSGVVDKLLDALEATPGDASLTSALFRLTRVPSGRRVAARRVGVLVRSDAGGALANLVRDKNYRALVLGAGAMGSFAREMRSAEPFHAARGIAALSHHVPTALLAAGVLPGLIRMIGADAGRPGRKHAATAIAGVAASRPEMLVDALPGLVHAALTDADAAVRAETTRAVAYMVIPSRRACHVDAGSPRTLRDLCEIELARDMTVDIAAAVLKMPVDVPRLRALATLIVIRAPGSSAVSAPGEILETRKLWRLLL